MPFGIDRHGDVHLRDVNLNSKCSEAANVGRNGRDIGVQVGNVHLQSDAVDGYTALPEIANHSIDRVRLGVHGFGLGLVIKQQSLRIGLMRPAETALDRSNLLRAASCELRANGIARAPGSCSQPFPRPIPGWSRQIVLRSFPGAVRRRPR